MPRRPSRNCRRGVDEGVRREDEAVGAVDVVPDVDSGVRDAVEVSEDEEEEEAEDEEEGVASD